ncbi:alpha/beta hydrolase [Pseudonocardia sp. DSM 110487]|uniref:dienelactone hydrolase family protein n=1 Tax=Pseudonocardia sp. DSM 110487 TaxID=2865833 RepID=UPI001C69968B|nr:alpha/beta family hydrolase [Pseudonocardia sp. DSM 110487]QYN39083.1 alpha/beta hydrolase [Pseudonocardia sp. DSM 110487]
MAQASATPIRITQADGVVVDGDLAIPDAATGLVVFAHGSGSSRHSRRNRHVASALQQRGLATLLMDLLTPDEEAIDAQTSEFRFDIELLARRLVGAADWLADEPSTRNLRLGYFGASTGAAAALVAAARNDRAAAIVSRGGRPDLAGGHALHAVRAPTLLIVGDQQVIELNEVAEDRMPAERQLVIVPGATHLFEEPGALDRVAELAGNWFVQHLTE